MGVAVFIVAHADDETLSMGPAIINHYNAGHKIYTVLCTDGGNSDTWPKYFSSLTRDQFCQARYNEYVKASAALGVYSQTGIVTSCATTGYNSLLRDSDYVNTGASHSVVTISGKSLLQCSSAGYYGNELGANYSKVNTNLYSALKTTLQAIASQQNVTTQQLLVKTHSHKDVHEDHRGVCQAVLRLYREGAITDVRHYVSPLQWTSIFEYQTLTFPSVTTLSAIQEKPSSNLDKLNKAIACYTGSSTTTAGGIIGTDSYGIGYLSVKAYFDKLFTAKASYYHTPPSILMS
jgi:LmbE family N-acetylglucosaminyl deacetylase